MTIKHMKTFLAVYRMRNITKAAEILSITQPAVSRTIREIEDYYGIRLFERMNRKLYITEAGERFYNYALHITDSFEQLETDMKNWDEFGRLRVGTSVTIGNALLPQCLLKFQKIHPELYVKAHIANGAYLRKMLLDNQLDFALIEGGINDEQLEKEVIGRDRLVLIMPPDDTRARQGKVFLSDFENDPLILREEGSMGRTLIDHIFGKRGIICEPQIESISTQAIVRLVHEGAGISFLPEQLVSEDIEKGYVTTKIIEDETFERMNYLVWHKQKYLTAAARELISIFREMSGS